MKQQIKLEEYNLPVYITEFITIWKTKKSYKQDGMLDIGQCIELLIATTHNLHFEHSDGRFFNTMLANQESIIGWEGDELIDILFYEIKNNIQKRITSSRTFNEIQPDLE